MQVLYKIAGSTQGYTQALCDETKGDALEKFSGVFAGILQREPLAGGTQQARFPRGNFTGKTRFKWASTYASADAAQAAIQTMDALKLTPLHLQLVEGSTTWYLPNATSENYEFDRQGSSVMHMLTFESDDLTIIPP